MRASYVCDAHVVRHACLRPAGDFLAGDAKGRRRQIAKKEKEKKQKKKKKRGKLAAAPTNAVGRISLPTA